MRQILRSLSLLLIFCIGARAVAAQNTKDRAKIDYASLANLDVATLQERANRGDDAAQTALGYKYDVGVGVPQDYSQALLWFRKAADRGNSFAQGSLGEMYYYGHGVSLDYGQAIAWYSKAANQGDPQEEFVLGYLYIVGGGTPQDFPKALLWFHKSANQGYASAQGALGAMYYKGIGVSRNYAQALAWCSKAAAQGDASAEDYMGVIYELGNGVPQDLTKARSWLQKAAVQGNGAARDELAKIGAQVPMPGLQPQVAVAVAQVSPTPQGPTKQDAHEIFVGTTALFLKTKNATQAKAGYLLVTKIDPTYAPAWFNLGVLSETDKNWIAAESDFRRYLQFAPTGPYAVRAKNELTVVQGNRTGANTPAASKEVNFDTSIQVARAFLANGYYKEAIAEAGRAEALVPSRWEPYAVVSVCMARQHNLSESTKYMQMAVSHAPLSKRAQVQQALTRQMSRTPN